MSAGSGNLSCSFCGKSQKEVKKLIAGPTVYICDECIGLCNDIIAEEIEKDTDRDRFMSAEEARDYGIIDTVISSRGEIVSEQVIKSQAENRT